MQASHRQALLRARLVLVESLDADGSGLWNQLLARRVFTRPMLDRILAERPPQERRQQLLDDLPTRGPDAFAAFAGILRATGQAGLADYLEAVHRRVEAGESAESVPLPAPHQQPLQPTQQPRRPSVERLPSRLEVINVPEQLPAEYFPGDTDDIPLQEVLQRHSGVKPATETEGVLDNRQLTPAPVKPEFLAAMRQNNWATTYRVLSQPKGLLLIISNQNFATKAKRSGTEVDCENLLRVFRNLGYELYKNKVFTDQTAGQMEKLCRDFILDGRHASLDSCVMCVLSHGDSGGVIYGSDDASVTEAQLFRHFNSPECRLHHKPKLVIIQACRGSMKDRGRIFDQPDSNAPTGAEAREEDTVQRIINCLQEENYRDTEDLKLRLPVLADVVFAHSTTPGFVSWRHELRGSWFIQSIAKVFAQEAHESHVLDMLTTVSRVVTQAFGGQKRVVMMPNPMSRLLKKFYFFPQSGASGLPPPGTGDR